jgi:hypothetical protein
LTYEDLPMQVLDRKEHQLRTKTMLLVMIPWLNQCVEEAKWVLEQQMQERFPYLF